MAYYERQTIRPTLSNVDFGVGELLKSGEALSKALGSVRAGELAANEQAKKDLLFTQAQEDRDRVKKEQEAFDKYFVTIAQGEQIKGGVLNTNELITESNKYDLTPEEQAKYSMYKGDALAARAAGDTVLADKIDWQMKLSGVADRLLESGIANEGRVGMYERAEEMVTDAGLPISKEMVAATDAARVEERTAKKEKKENITKQLDELAKQELDMQKYYGNKIGGTSMVDEDGNPVTLSSRNKSQKDPTKGIAEGTTALAEAVNKMEGLSPEEKAAATKLATDQFNLITSRGVTPEAAAEFISNGLSSKDTGMWFWSGKEPKLNTDMVNKFVDTYKVAEAKLGTTGTVGATRDTSKEDYARDLLMLTSQNNATKRAQLQSELAALDMTADERREVGLSELLRKNGVLPQVNTEASNVSTGTNYASKVAKVESGSDYSAVNERSGAIGKYQFLPSTLNDFKGKYGNPNFTDEEFKSNPALQEKVFKQFTTRNENILSNLGVEVNDYTRWLAHNLGAGNVKDFIEGNQTPRLTKAIGAQFNGKKTSIKDYNDRFAKEFTGSKTANTNVDPAVRLAMFDAAPGEEIDISESRVKELFSKIGDINGQSTGETSQEIRALIDELNKSGQGEKAKDLNSKYAALLQKEKAERKAKTLDNLRSANLFELLGVAPERKRVQVQEDLTPELDASLEEPALEHDFTWIPGLGLLNKTRNKTGMYDDMYKGVFKSDKGRLLDDVLRKDPLRVQEDVLRQTFGNKTVDVLDDIFKKYGDMSRTDLLTEAARLRNIEKPSSIDLAALEKLQQLLRSSR